MTRDSAAALTALTALEVEYWYEVDFNWGRRAEAMYVDNGVFAIGDHVMTGREAVAQFYGWREGRGARTARHVVTNFRLEETSEQGATLRCILLLYAADGEPVLPSRPAILIADVLSECVWDEDGLPRYRSHRLIPVFQGGEPTVPPKS